MDNNSSNTTNTSGTSKGRRVLGSDPELVKRHDIQLKEVEKTMRMRVTGMKENKSRPHSRSRSDSSERVPSRQLSSNNYMKVETENIPAKGSKSSHQSLKSPKKSIHKLKEDHLSTPFLDELNLYMKQAKFPEDEDGSESDSADSLKSLKQSSDIDLEVTKETPIHATESKHAMKKPLPKKKVSSPPLSDESDEDEYSSATSSTSQSDSDDSNADYSDKAQKIRVKTKGKVKALSVSTMAPKVESKVLTNVSASNIDQDQVKRYLSECEESVVSSDRSSSNVSSQNRISSYRHNNSTTRQLDAVNVPELTMMVQQIPKIINFDKNPSSLKKSTSSVHISGKKEVRIVVPPVVPSVVKPKPSEYQIRSRGNSSVKEFRYQVGESNSISSKYGSAKSNCDRTTIKLSHLSPDEMPAALLKSMVEGVVAVTEPEFEPQSTLRFPTKSLYVLFKSEETANKAMAFLKESNIQCDYRTIE